MGSELEKVRELMKIVEKDKEFIKIIEEENLKIEAAKEYIENCFYREKVLIPQLFKILPPISMFTKDKLLQKKFTAVREKMTMIFEKYKNN